MIYTVFKVSRWYHERVGGKSEVRRPFTQIVADSLDAARQEAAKRWPMFTLDVAEDDGTFVPTTGEP